MSPLSPVVSPAVSAVFEALGWALVHSLWQGAALALLAALGLRYVDRRAAALRYGIALAALVLLPLLTVTTALRAYVPPEPEVAALPSTSVLVPSTLTAAPETSAAPAAALAPEPAPLQGAALLAQLQQHLADALPWLVLAWALGVCVSSVRLLRGHLLLQRLVRSAQPAPADWQARLDRLASRMGLSRAVALLETSGLDGPATLGWLVPVVLVPVSTLAGLPPRQLEMVLAHELAHIRRHDFAVNLLQALVETLFFYHPAVAWLGRAVRDEREHCCDDLAVAACGSAVSYARALTALEALRLPGAQAALPALSATGGTLAERVRRLVLPPRAVCGSRWLAGASALTLASSLAVAAPLSLLVLPAVVPPPETVAAPESEIVRSAPSELLAQASPASEPSRTELALRAEPATPAPPAPAARAARAAPAARPAPAPPAAPAAPAAKVTTPDADADEDEKAAENEVEEDEKPDNTRVGAGPLTVDQLIRLRNAGITGARVKELQALGFTPTVDNLVELGHAGVTTAYAKEMKDAFGRSLSPDELVEMRHMGVSSEFIRALKSQGYTGLTPEQAVSARAVGVNEQYVKELQQLGYGKLSLDALQDLRALGVTGSYVKELKELGYSGLSVKQLSELRAMGVTGQYVRSLRDAGFTKLGVADLVRLRATGVDAEFVRELQGQRK